MMEEMIGEAERGRRPGVGDGGFVPLTPPPLFRSSLPGSVVLRETPSGIVMAATRWPMIILVGLLAAIAAGVGGALVATRPHSGPVVVMGVVALVLAGGIPAVVLAATWRRVGNKPPILVEHLHEGAIELPRLRMRVPTTRITAVQSVSGWVVKRDSDGSEALYASQLLAIMDDEVGARRRLLIASVPTELSGEARRLARRLAAYLGVPHEHIQVRVRGGVQWDDLFNAPDRPNAASA